LIINASKTAVFVSILSFKKRIFFHFLSFGI